MPRILTLRETADALLGLDYPVRARDLSDAAYARRIPESLFVYIGGRRHVAEDKLSELAAALRRAGIRPTIRAAEPIEHLIHS